MNTQTLERANVLKKDMDGNWYSLPWYLEDDFIRTTEGIQNAEYLSPEWFEGHAELSTLFGVYLKD